MFSLNTSDKTISNLPFKIGQSSLTQFKQKTFSPKPPMILFPCPIWILSCFLSKVSYPLFLLDPVFNFYTTLNCQHIENFITFFTAYELYPVSCLTCRISCHYFHVTYYISCDLFHITCHMSPVPCPLLFRFIFSVKGDKHRRVTK